MLEARGRGDRSPRLRGKERERDREWPEFQGPFKVMPVTPLPPTGWWPSLWGTLMISTMTHGLSTPQDPHLQIGHCKGVHL